MHTNNRLKVCALLFHFFIIVGMGHGVGTLGVVEIVGLSDIGAARLIGSLSSPFEDFIHTIALSSLLGQLAIILSFIVRRQRAAGILHLLGLLMLWISVIYLLVAAAVNSGVYTSFLFCIPLLVCTIWPLFKLIAQPINKWMDA